MADRFDYAGLTATAQRLLDRYGSDASLIPYAEPYTTEWGMVPDSGDPVAIVALISNYSQSERANTAIETGDMRAFISTAGLSVAPKASDQIILAGVTWKVVEVEQIAPSGVAILYKARVRK